METRTRRILLSLANLGSLILVITVNALANILPIAGRNTGEISDMYPNLFVPAGLTFSIWGVIYLLLAAFTLVQLLEGFRRNPPSDSFLERIGPLFLLSSLANAGWILVWHNLLTGVSLVVMLILFGSLFAIYQRFGIGKAEGADLGPKVRYLVHLPFSIYFGWISIALIANVTAFLVDIGLTGSGVWPQFWAVSVIAVGSVLAFMMMFLRKDILYALVAAWAFAGIVIKRIEVTGVADTAVLIAAAIGLGLIVIGVIAQLVRKEVY